MLIPLWLRLSVGAVLAGAVAFGGYKIGAWKGAAGGAEAAKTAAESLAACNASLATQRETDLSGANHALEDQLRDATVQAHSDALALADLAAKMQSNSLNFAANTRALYAISVGACSFSPDLVGLLRRASDEANTADRNGAADKTTAPKTDVGNGATAPVPKPAGKSQPARSKSSGPVGRVIRN